MEEIAQKESQAIGKTMRERVQTLQEVMLKLEPCEFETEHTFHGGIYCREVKLDAGTIIVGKVHKSEHFLYIIYGEMELTINDAVEYVVGPRLIVGNPGDKRALFAITDVMFTNVHKTDATNTADAEQELIEPDESSVYDSNNRLKSKNLIGE
jgi:quercetin dioxygenase-like cupin family protein